MLRQAELLNLTLWVSARRGNTSNVQFLLRRGVDANACEALQVAVRRSKWYVVDLLLSYGANLDLLAENDRATVNHMYAQRKDELTQVIGSQCKNKYYDVHTTQLIAAYLIPTQ